MTARRSPAAAQMLRQSGLVSPEDMRRAEQLARATKVGIEEASVSLGLLSEDQVLYLVAQTHGVDFVFPSAGNVDADLVRRFPADVLREHAAVPMIVEEGHAVVAFAEVPDRDALDALTRHAGMPVKPVLASARRVQTTLEQLIGRETRADSSPQDLAGMNAFYRHLASAFGAGADEIRFEPSSDGLRVRVRRDGRLSDAAREPAEVAAGVAARARRLAGLPDAAEPQVADVDAKVAKRVVPLRLVIVPGDAGALVVLTRREAAPARTDLAACGLPQDLADWLRGPFAAPAGAADAASGLVLVAATDRGTLGGFVGELLDGLDERNSVALVTRDETLASSGRTLCAADDVAGAVHALRIARPDVLYVDGGTALRGAAESVYAAAEGVRVVFGLVDPRPEQAIRDLLAAEKPPSRLRRVLAAIVVLAPCRVLCAQCACADPAPDGWEGARVATGCAACDGRGHAGTTLAAAGVRVRDGADTALAPPSLAERLRELVAAGRVSRADACALAAQGGADGGGNVVPPRQEART